MRAFAGAATAALLLAGFAGAQNVPTVTEAEFLAPLDAAHPAVAAAREELGEAEAAALGARALANPELGATREAPGDAEQLDLTLSWRPPHPTRRRLAVAAADARVEAARARYAADRTVLRQAMREAFARWAIGTAVADRLVAQAAQVDELAARERRRAESGETSGLDARRLALASSNARTQLARAEAERRAAVAAARAWRPDLAAEARPELPPLPEPSSAAAAAEHPRVAALRAELEAAQLGERFAGRIFDMPEVVGGWQRQDAGGVAEGPIVGLAWPLPLLDRRRGERAAARVRVEALQARLLLAEREVAATRVGALAAYEELLAAALDAETATEDARRVVVAATAAFRAGEAGVTDLLETLRSATDAQVDALALRAEALAAQRELERLSADEPTSIPPQLSPPPPGTTPSNPPAPGDRR